MPNQFNLAELDGFLRPYAIVYKQVDIGTMWDTVDLFMGCCRYEPKTAIQKFLGGFNA